ncbi:flavodoxin family protein [Carboxydothermus hydrogenoformans]|uniref:FMN reductase, NADPH-dependent n=1 Tax=Carboxydothermus hydrogenoformans (strain ATCC BAA-161 / DSM 6008 / Z-2901) TaxID=246194 RepID=Q3AEI3_CARHZ|nr:flavodoxin family protein [Carboxydothermus hydrogenoformans]ABB15275.1 FMN reductase, NADPH-dependent [Carboxydothermus hydrogenoformans Z-2901]
MKVFALMGSPREGSNTDILIEEALKPAREAGWEVEKFNIDQLYINPCRGCMECRGTGDCSLEEDDILVVARAMAEADAYIIGAPVYGNHLPGQVKVLFDRLSGLIHKVSYDGASLRSQSRLPHKKRRVFIFAVAAAGRPESCDGVLRYLKFFVRPELNGGEVFELAVTGVGAKGQIGFGPEELEKMLIKYNYDNPEEKIKEYLDLHQKYLNLAREFGQKILTL